MELEGLEVACFEKLPKHIPPQQVYLMEKEIINKKTLKLNLDLHLRSRCIFLSSILTIHGFQ